MYLILKLWTIICPKFKNYNLLNQLVKKYIIPKVYLKLISSTKVNNPRVENTFKTKQNFNKRQSSFCPIASIVINYANNVKIASPLRLYHSYESKYRSSQFSFKVSTTAHG